MNTIVSFIIVLGVLIFVHELGHFLFAKLFGVRVLKFSLGFGPKLVGKVVGDTEYVISVLPLGGYVKMLGENPDEQQVDAAEQYGSFAHKAVWKRFCIVLAGPLFNLLFALVLFFFLFVAIGVPKVIDTARIGKVIEGSPAFSAGIKPGDVVIRIDGSETKVWDDVLEGVKKSAGQPLAMEVRRGQEVLSLNVAPKLDSVPNIFGEKGEKHFMIGIAMDDTTTYARVGVIPAFKEACVRTWFYIKITVLGFIKLAQRVIPASEMGGPILIAQLAGEHMKAGWIDFAYFMGLISVNLGILNLLPIPVLDGGHLAFMMIEGLRRKPVHERAQIIAQQIGITLLVGLMVFVFYNDIVRLLKQWHLIGL